MDNTLFELCSLLAPNIEEWLRATIREEMEKVLAEDHEKQKLQKLYSRDEVCAMLGITKPTLWARTKAGDLKCSKVGHRVLYAESEIQKALANKTVMRKVNPQRT